MARDRSVEDQDRSWSHRALPVRHPSDHVGSVTGPRSTNPGASSSDAFSVMDRRHAIKALALVAGAPAIAGCGIGESDPVGGGSGIADTPDPSSNPRARGDAWDPDLVNPVIPWERTLSAEELAGLAALCDLIIPADERSPSASAVGAHEFIDEWVSAPYEDNQKDGVLVRGGLIWLDREASRRFGSGSGGVSESTDRPQAEALRFRDLDFRQQAEICDEICNPATAAPELQFAARFFDRVRFLASTAFWTTDEGMDDIGYVGNVALPSWDPLPPEVLHHIGLGGE